MNRPTDASERIWEGLGICAGLGTCLGLAAQAHAAWAGHPPRLSPVFLLALLAVFAFWTLYGWRFRRPALWLTNGLALLLQIALLAGCWR